MSADRHILNATVSGAVPVITKSASAAGFVMNHASGQALSGSGVGAGVGVGVGAGAATATGTEQRAVSTPAVTVNDATKSPAVA